MFKSLLTIDASNDSPTSTNTWLHPTGAKSNEQTQNVTGLPQFQLFLNTKRIWRKTDLIGKGKIRTFLRGMIVNLWRLNLPFQAWAAAN